MTDISDVSVKENVQDIQGALTIIEDLRPVSYDFKSSYFDSIPGDAKEMLYNEKKNSIGFIAQEVQEVMPDLVTTISKDEKLGVNTIDMIPLLVKAIQEQQEKIASLENQVASFSEYGLKGTAIQTDIDQLDGSSASLSQNIPNPFDENTIIKYTIPEIKSFAIINVYDLQGSQVKSYRITQTGEGEIVIPGSELYPGLFIYNLIVDGIELESRRMILTQ